MSDIGLLYHPCVWGSWSTTSQAGLAELVGTALLVFLGCGTLIGIPVWHFWIVHHQGRVQTFETSNILYWHMDIWSCLNISYFICVYIYTVSSGWLTWMKIQTNGFCSVFTQMHDLCFASCWYLQYIFRKKHCADASRDSHWKKTHSLLE